ncbi:WS/DGAT/MGAT family acyltransferase [Kribbella amoyensis]|uniref:Diacylglycerol O-acyltransferase n=1 Tax=Kribbella amoyensis TaxID=996641 RepID=A0A561BLN9_9ACTN|nr:wax ester/triacylglycerol synthase family O-acyltransferase [Kribbella amoyensis]TWD79804.1 WS/DGAT/MGAT family acyltransferase [Kribbella amoyensis]
MTAVGPLDAMFLLGETREQPMHVGGLMLLEVPDSAGRDHVFPDGTDRDYVATLYREIVEQQQVNPLFAQRVRNRVRELGYWSWEPDEEIDLEYHVRLSGLARPGRYRELFELTSRLHGTLLDRHRPLWEMHLIDGIEGRRFAIYHKVHHSMIDGVTALRWMQATLTDDPNRTGMPPTYALPPLDAPADVVAEEKAAVWSELARTGGRAAGGTWRVLSDLVGLTPVGLKSAWHAVRSEHSPVAFQAPMTILNGPITGARRFAAQSWPKERLEKVRASTGATLNDVLLAMCSGALRNYLLDLGALPDQPMTAMVPVSLRTGDQDAPGGGNALATLIADLATDESDPEQRIRRITDSTAYGKRVLSQLTPLQNLMIGALGLGAAGPAAVVPALAGRTPPPYNVVISNVPGPGNGPLYWNGARVLGMYPASVVLNGQALNISVTTYDRQVHFGLTGCRRTVPHLQRLLQDLETALVDLEQL